jgi:hypothetical protein
VISGNGAHGLGIWHEQSDGNTVENNLVGLNPSATARLPNQKHGMDINFGGSSNVYQDNVVSGNNGTGIEISHTIFTRDNQILGNFIGTDVTGTRGPFEFANRTAGVAIEDGATSNLIANNVIGNNRSGGILIDFDVAPTNNVIRDNRIGIGLDGSPIPNNNAGMRINGQSNQVGPGNIIAHNGANGIKLIGNASDFNTITRNSIFNNGLLGISLDPGTNGGINFPVLQNASTSQVSGTACGGCTVEVFIADSGAGQNGEGRTFVGSGVAGGNGSFTVNVSGVAPGSYLTATATDGAGNTSEFSLNLQVGGAAAVFNLYLPLVVKQAGP